MDTLLEYGSDGEAGESPQQPQQQVALKRSIDPEVSLQSIEREIYKNPMSYEEMYAPVLGPVAPHLTKKLPKQNLLSGNFEVAGMDGFHFEEQRKTFAALGYAMDPSDSGRVVGNTAKASELEGKTISNRLPQLGQKRRRLDKGDPSDPLNYQGPWAGYEGENIHLTFETKEEDGEKEESEKQKKEDKDGDEYGPGIEKTIFHGKEKEKDYQGRTYMHPPADLDTDPKDCFLPKRLIHTWSGHTKGVTAIRFFPNTSHLLLSSSMDCKVKLWDVYNEKKCLRTFIGHTKMVRDVCFSNDGKRFLSCGYDKYIKLWDTETGQCISRFTNKRIPYCVKFNPDDDKQNIFLAGCSDKKIIQWDANTGKITQEYDQHLGAVNTITFVDQNRRFVTTSDDKSLRVWEWNIPVVIKYVAEPHMHSMPAVTVHPNQKWMACQSLDNQILIYGATDKFRQNNKKVFKGHVVAGYACQVNFSPDGRYIFSGDAEGHLWFWDWKTCKVVKKMKCHDQVLIGCEWNPNETSKVATCSWDGTIKYWD